MILAHLPQNLYEESDLDLGGLLQKSVKGSRALGLTEDAEPLLDRTELILEVLIQSSRSHFFQGCLILINVRDPLLRNLILCVMVQAGLARGLLGLNVKV